MILRGFYEYPKRVELVSVCGKKEELPNVKYQGDTIIRVAVRAMSGRVFFKGQHIYFKVVQSVFDEETATEVIKSYLKIIRDADLPEESKLTFKHCQFDSDSGISSFC